MAETDVSWDEAALSVYLTEVELALLPDLTSSVEDTARAIAPMSAGPKRGKLKASVRSDVGQDYLGWYGDVIALWYGRFLDPKARQLRRLYPFLPSALYFTLSGREYFL